MVGIDSSPEMLAYASAQLPNATFLVQRLEDPLPDGPFDLVVSAFAIHHLDGPGKADLFARVAATSAPGGRFVFCDVVLPDRDVERPVLLDEGIDQPSRLDDQVAWLELAGLRPKVVVEYDDLAIVAAFGIDG